MPDDKPSPFELQILSLLWEHGPMPARQVLELLPDGKKRAYTSVLSVMQVMEKKGFLTHSTEGNRHVYKPTVKRSQVMGNVMGGMVRNLFGGSPVGAMQFLLESSQVSPEELKQMQELLKTYGEEKPRREKH